MLKPTYRTFIIPLGAICMLASFSMQAGPQMPTEITPNVRLAAIDCSAVNPADVCVIEAR